MRNVQSLISTIFLAIILVGCTTTRIVRETETTVRDTILTVAPPAIHDTLSLVEQIDTSRSAIQPDTSWVAESPKSPGVSTPRVRVKVNPKARTVEIAVQPDTLRIDYRDTTQVTKNVIKEETPLILNILYVMLAIVFVAGVGVAIWKFKR